MLRGFRSRFAVRAGLGLVESAAVLGVIAVSLAGLAMMQRDASRTVQAVAAAERLLQVRQAAERYLRDRRETLLAELPVGGAPVLRWAGRASTTEPPPANSLQALGFLAADFVDANAYGHRHAVLLRRPQADRLEALVVQTGGRAVEDRHLSMMARRLGGHGAIMLSRPLSATQGRVEGAGGGFLGDASAWSVGGVSPSPGRAMAYAQWSSRLALGDALGRDATGAVAAERMFADIDMNQRDIQAAGEARGVRSVAEVYRVAAPSGSCSVQGEISVSEQGELLLCWNGAWRPRRTVECGSPGTEDLPECTGSADGGQGGGGAGCQAGTVSWGQGCSASVPALTHGQATTVSHSGSSQQWFGSASVSCRNGVLSVAGVCLRVCSPQTVVWSGETSGCTGTTMAAFESGIVTVRSNQVSQRGTGRFRCLADGSWQLVQASCRICQCSSCGVDIFGDWYYGNFCGTSYESRCPGCSG